MRFARFFLSPLSWPCAPLQQSEMIVKIIGGPGLRVRQLGPGLMALETPETPGNPRESQRIAGNRTGKRKDTTGELTRKDTRDLA